MILKIIDYPSILPVSYTRKQKEMYNKLYNLLSDAIKKSRCKNIYFTHTRP